MSQGICARSLVSPVVKAMYCMVSGLNVWARLIALFNGRGQYRKVNAAIIDDYRTVHVSIQFIFNAVLHSYNDIHIPPGRTTQFVLGRLLAVTTAAHSNGSGRWPAVRRQLGLVEAISVNANGLGLTAEQIAERRHTEAL